MVTIIQDGTGDYTNLKAAIDADETEINILGPWTIPDAFTGTLTIDAANPTTITVLGAAATSGQPHNGAATTYRLRKTDAGHVFTLSDDVTITGMDLQNESTGSSDECFRFAASADITLTDCVAGFASRNSEQDIIFDNINRTHVLTFTNVAFYNAERAVCDFQNGTVTINLNCVSAFDIGNEKTTGTRSGIVGVTTLDSLTVRSFNSTYQMNNSFPFNATAGQAYTLTVDRSITSNDDWANTWGTETITDSLISRTWTDTLNPGAGDFVIVNDATISPYDLRLQKNATDNDAQDLHLDNSGASLPMPADDVKGTLRPQNVNFDAGFFEIASPTITGKSTSPSRNHMMVVQSVIALPEEAIEISGLPASFPHCFLSARFFDAAGDPVVPSGGTVTVTISTVGGVPFFEIVPSNVITASDPVTVSWAANTDSIRAIPAGLIAGGVDTWNIVATFNLT